MLLTNLGLLARYDQMTFLDGLRDAAGHPDGPPGVWLLAEFLQVAELYTGRADFDVAKLVARLVEDESVPLLPVLRYKPSGLRKRAAGSAPGLCSGWRTPSTRASPCPWPTLIV